MSISIENEVVESLLREYAGARGIGLIEAVARAVRIATEVERVERTERTRREAFERFREIGDVGWSSEGERWTRDELHER